MPLELSIVTPDAEAVHVTCDEVTAPGISGELGLLPGHIPVITALRPGLLSVYRGGKRTVYVVSSGFAELEGERLTVLTDICELSADVDVDRARREAEAAALALVDLGEADPDYAIHRARLERAEARLLAASVAGRS